MRILKPLLPAVAALLLAACADAPSRPDAPGPVSSPGLAPVVPGVVVAQPAPPALRLEHPGRPPATGYLWIAGYWSWGGVRYEWTPGRWVAPRPGYVWVPHAWQRDGERWRQEGGRWEEQRREGRLRR
ncbi:MAG: hypothetical protein RJA36_704 [Pseudomonadota bacterium]|jgi:hypothetical protein